MSDTRTAAIYYRLSTLDQTPENQLAELRRYVAARGREAVERARRVRHGDPIRRDVVALFNNGRSTLDEPDGNHHKHGDDWKQGTDDKHRYGEWTGNCGHRGASRRRHGGRQRL